MSKLKLPIIIAIVLAAAGAGLFFSGLLGSDTKAKKHNVPAIKLTDPFLINLSDENTDAYLSFSVAVKLEPMDDEHFAAFMGEDAGHGGTAESPGAAQVATYPDFYDAVNNVASTFNSDDLKTQAGKARLETALLDRFHEIEQVDTADLKSSAAAGDPAHVGPPYHVIDITFPKFVIQTS